MALSAGIGAASADCAKPPAAVRDLDLPRFYADDSGSIVDPELLAKHRAAVEPLTEFLRHVAADADKSVRRSKAEQQAEAAVCAIVWLDAWARGEAWLGNMASRQGEYQRKWDLGGVALAYLKVRAFANEDERRRIEAWLLRWADLARAFFDDRERKRNNHWYWLGLGLAATGLAANSPRHWDMAREIMSDAARDIQADGTLPQEMERKARALHYHVFAVTPLVVLAELGFARGEDWYQLGDGALHRLVAVTARGLRDPRLFQAMPLVATLQEPDTSAGAGWLTLYGQRFKARIEPGWPSVNPSHRWLGGDVQALAKVLGTGP
jgi:poly(beta-D-mannuronate) lyase